MLRRALAALVTALGLDEWEHEWCELGGADAETTSRWCWVAPWRFCSQDEDLDIMHEHLVGVLLDEAGRGCPKRAYAIRIVEHFVRDRAHATIDSSPSEMRARLCALGEHAVAARAAGADALVTYLERLPRYCEPRAIGEADARAQALDFWRCYAPPDLAVSLLAGTWRATNRGAPRDRTVIAIDAKSGVMRREAA